ncbi:uncharacterized protein LOC143317620 isoform X1 [Chaetodon auriga]|uniref:uncharacterized protein LOC143315722 isoform X1 n=1 Tax=Chaetodon auriga TaxID=39042 RepID=UPI004032AE85
MVSSSEGEGSGDWQPPKNGTEEEEEEEEASLKQRVPQLHKKDFLPSASPRLMASSSEGEGSGDWQSPKNGTVTLSAHSIHPSRNVPSRDVSTLPGLLQAKAQTKTNEKTDVPSPPYPGEENLVQQPQASVLVVKTGARRSPSK